MKTWAIVGANRGIGLELTTHLKNRGDKVIAACRHSSPALAALEVEVIEGIDVTKASSVAELERRLTGRSIDVLVAMAGVLRRDTLDTLDLDTVREHLEVNALGPLRVVQALLPNLGAGSKVALVTSRMGSLADNTSGNYYGYRMSKAALNMAGKSLAIDLKARGVAVCLLHPGFVRTDMTGRNGDVDPDVAAGRLLQRIDGLTLEQTGAFWHANGERLPW